jgi:negative regulator of flagellin synthesis FlgM
MQGSNGTMNKKIKELSDISGDSRNAATSSGYASSQAPTNQVVGLSLTPAFRERLEKSLASVPDVDSQRVLEIKAALASGSLKIDADTIADAMMRLDRSLGD